MSIFNYRERPGYFQRLKEALKSTKDELGHKINQLTGQGESPITEGQLEDLEAALIGADIGVDTTLEILDRIREETRGNRFVTSRRVRQLIREHLREILHSVDSAGLDEGLALPSIVLVVGVNGVGKTTTIGKIAQLYQAEGKSVLLCAADTFRAAAVEQLDIWAKRTGCELVKQQPGADPAAVLFDAIAAARARGKDAVIVDTAGRLHTKSNLMKELEKIRRVASREVQGAPHEVFLVLDATTGQNGLLQAQEFQKITGLTGIIVAKLDGTAKGGIIVAIAKRLKVPIRYIGIGEKATDLLPFDADAFVDSLLPEATSQEM